MEWYHGIGGYIDPMYISLNLYTYVYFFTFYKTWKTFY